MLRWTDLSQVPAGFGPSVVTIGNFDGVHRGHAAVLSRLVALAHADQAKAVAVTFDPHPRAVHHPEGAPPAITCLADRLDLMAATGLDAALVLTYTWEFAQQTAAEFVRDCLVQPLGMKRIVVGHDVRFGRGNVGNLQTLRELGDQWGFAVEVIDDVGSTREGAARWSSTRVREFLARGEVVAATELLGRHHSLTGVVVHGDARGRTLGFPTANVGEVPEVIPADGVYAGWLLAHGERFPAAVSVGTNPTFDGPQRRVEAYVLDRTDLDLYGAPVRVEFVARVRGQIKFDGVEPLIDQMHEDVAVVRQLLLN